MNRVLMESMLIEAYKRTHRSLNRVLGLDNDHHIYWMTAGTMNNTDYTQVAGSRDMRDVLGEIWNDKSAEDNWRFAPDALPKWPEHKPIFTTYGDYDITAASAYSGWLDSGNRLNPRAHGRKISDVVYVFKKRKPGEAPKPFEGFDKLFSDLKTKTHADLWRGISERPRRPGELRSPSIQFMYEDPISIKATANVAKQAEPAAAKVAATASNATKQAPAATNKLRKILALLGVGGGVEGLRRYLKKPPIPPASNVVGTMGKVALGVGAASLARHLYHKYIRKYKANGKDRYVYAKGA